MFYVYYNHLLHTKSNYDENGFYVIGKSYFSHSDYTLNVIAKGLKAKDIVRFLEGR